MAVVNTKRPSHKDVSCISVYKIISVYCVCLIIVSSSLLCRMIPQRTNMWIFLVILTLLVAANCQHDRLVEKYYGETTNEGDSPAKSRCQNIDADIKECNDCFKCDDERITRKARPEMTRLNLTDSSCQTSEFCCIPLSSIVSRSHDNCGESHPEGKPRALRPSLRSVLPGEYPWRAWLYNSTSLLCAATFINDNSGALVTSAACVKDSMNQQLYVRFDKGRTSYEVRQMIPCPGSEIVLIQVKALPTSQQQWIQPVCLPYSDIPFGTCIAISDDDHFLYTALAKPEVCDSEKMGGERTLCAVAPSGDYRPEPGSALFCPDHSAQTLKYILHGVALETNANGYTKYAKMLSAIDWLNNELSNLPTIQVTRVSGYYHYH